MLDYGSFKAELNMSLAKLKESCVIKGTKGEIRLTMFHMASKAVLKKGKKTTIFRGKTDYNTEFTRVSNEIKNGLIQSKYVPFSSTLDCMKIMDECRHQMNLVYPFER